MAARKVTALFSSRKMFNYTLKKRLPLLNYAANQTVVKYSITRDYCATKSIPQKEYVTINLNLTSGETKTVQAKVGDNLLDVIIDNDLDISGFGACEGTLACSTCHLIFKPEDYECIPEKPTDEELDMLDLAYGLTEMSRLGCQVIVTKEMNNWDVVVPAGVSDAREP